MLTFWQIAKKKRKRFTEWQPYDRSTLLLCPAESQATRAYNFYPG